MLRYNLLQGRLYQTGWTDISEIPNIDLLYPARKSLGAEAGKLPADIAGREYPGHVRHDDIPGALIPSVYFNYLEDRDASGIRRS